MLTGINCDIMSVRSMAQSAMTVLGSILVVFGFDVVVCHGGQVLVVVVVVVTRSSLEPSFTVPLRPLH